MLRFLRVMLHKVMLTGEWLLCNTLHVNMVYTSKLGQSITCVSLPPCLHPPCNKLCHKIDNLQEYHRCMRSQPCPPTTIALAGSAPRECLYLSDMEVTYSSTAVSLTTLYPCFIVTSSEGMHCALKAESCGCR